MPFSHRSRISGAEKQKKRLAFNKKLHAVLSVESRAYLKSTIKGYQSGAPVQTLLVSLGRLLNKPKKIALLDEIRQLIKDGDLAVYDEEVLIWRETGVPPGTTVGNASYGAKGQKAVVHREPTYKSVGLSSSRRELAVVEIRKGKKTGEHLGLKLRRQNGRNVVGAVATGSAADAAGLRENDMLVTLNGIRVEKCSHAEALDALASAAAGPSKAIKLVIRPAGSGAAMHRSTQQQQNLEEYSRHHQHASEASGRASDVSGHSSRPHAAGIERSSRAPSVASTSSRSSDGSVMDTMLVAPARVAESRTVRMHVEDGKIGVRINGGTTQPLIITTVDKGSAAEHAGLKQGDALLRVNGIDFTSISHKEAVKVLQSNKHLMMSVRNLGKIAAVNAVDRAAAPKHAASAKASRAAINMMHMKQLQDRERYQQQQKMEASANARARARAAAAPSDSSPKRGRARTASAAVADPKHQPKKRAKKLKMSQIDAMLKACQSLPNNAKTAAAKSAAAARNQSAETSTRAPVAPATTRQMFATLPQQIMSPQIESLSMFERAAPISPLDGFTLSDNEGDAEEEDRVTPYNNLAAPSAASSQLGPGANPFLAQIRSFKPGKVEEAKSVAPSRSSLPEASGRRKLKPGASVYNGFGKDAKHKHKASVYNGFGNDSVKSARATGAAGNPFLASIQSFQPKTLKSSAVAGSRAVIPGTSSNRPNSASLFDQAEEPNGFGEGFEERFEDEEETLNQNQKADNYDTDDGETWGFGSAAPSPAAKASPFNQASTARRVFDVQSSANIDAAIDFLRGVKNPSSLATAPKGKATAAAVKAIATAPTPPSAKKHIKTKKKMPPPRPARTAASTARAAAINAAATTTGHPAPTAIAVAASVNTAPVRQLKIVASSTAANFDNDDRDIDLDEVFAEDSKANTSVQSKFELEYGGGFGIDVDVDEDVDVDVDVDVDEDVDDFDGDVNIDFAGDLGLSFTGGGFDNGFDTSMVSTNAGNVGGSDVDSDDLGDDVDLDFFSQSTLSAAEPIEMTGSATSSPCASKIQGGANGYIDVDVDVDGDAYLSIEAGTPAVSSRRRSIATPSASFAMLSVSTPNPPAAATAQEEEAKSLSSKKKLGKSNLSRSFSASDIAAAVPIQMEIKVAPTVPPKPKKAAATAPAPAVAPKPQPVAPIAGVVAAAAALSARGPVPTLEQKSNITAARAATAVLLAGGSNSTQADEDAAAGVQRESKSKSKSKKHKKHTKEKRRQEAEAAEEQKVTRKAAKKAKKKERKRRDRELREAEEATPKFAQAPRAPPLPTMGFMSGAANKLKASSSAGAGLGGPANPFLAQVRSFKPKKLKSAKAGATKTPTKKHRGSPGSFLSIATSPSTRASNSKVKAAHMSAALGGKKSNALPSHMSGAYRRGGAPTPPPRNLKPALSFGDGGSGSGSAGGGGLISQIKGFKKSKLHGPDTRTALGNLNGNNNASQKQEDIGMTLANALKKRFGNVRRYESPAKMMDTPDKWGAATPGWG